MTDNSSNFEEEFSLSVQKKFLSILVFDTTWASLEGLSIVKPEFFENRILQNICKWIHRYYGEYKNIPTESVLKELTKEHINSVGLQEKEYFRYTEVIDEVFTITSSDDFEFFKDKAVAFARQIAWKNALSKAGSALKLKNEVAAVEEFKKVMSIGSIVDLGLQLDNFSIDEFVNLLGETYDYSNMVKTGIPEWDAGLGGGFVANNLHIIGGAPGYGKAVSIYTAVLTPCGWVNAGDVKKGDLLVGRDGKPTEVLEVYPQGVKRNFRIEFNDESVTNSCNEHLWTVMDQQQHNKTKEYVYTLQQIMDKGVLRKTSPSRVKSSRKPTVRWKIPLVEPVQFEEKPQIISAYNMGALLGDGYIGRKKIVLINGKTDDFIANKFISLLPEEMDHKIFTYPGSVQYSLRNKGTQSLQKNIYVEEFLRLGLLETRSHNKFIPYEYKFGSVDQRIELLRGLMDTDGSIAKGTCSSCIYTTLSIALAKDVLEVVQSLGGTGRIKKTPDYRKENYFYYKVIFMLNKINPFSLPRKAANWRETNRGRYITNIVEQEPVESVCFKVDNKDELFVINDYIVTHNSRTMAYLAIQALKQRKNTIFITLELSEVETMANILTAATGVVLADMLKKEEQDMFSEKVQNFLSRNSKSLAVKFFKPATVTTDAITNYIHKIVQMKRDAGDVNWKPHVIFLDYLDKLLPTQAIKGSSYEDVGGVADDCKNLGITFECPVISGSQLGKYTWNITGDSVVTMDSISESAKKVHLCHSMTTINANKDEKASGVARLYLAKSRSGKPGTIAWCRYDLGRCNLVEIPEWDPNEIYAPGAKFTIKDNSGKK